MHVVERFTRTGEDSMHYSFTVEDPDTWSAPWSGGMDIRRTEGPIYEYACHEGNLGLANILSAARAAERPRRLTRQRAGMSAGASRRRNFHAPFSRTN